MDELDARWLGFVEFPIDNSCKGIGFELPAACEVSWCGWGCNSDVILVRLARLEFVEPDGTGSTGKTPEQMLASRIVEYERHHEDQRDLGACRGGAVGAILDD
ncbi:hypothetical protein LGH82_26385 [Mesorhizobium sp. PAMC28654]|uniref:hypothetical protein n=1 Tax=Mesorhizobium sp. PAMC28654 TaxID=2880934 RepID=UPI001D0B8CF0|nr:hypothetical protein [Mesorhizobium sp. PAMC28654]UDL88617.1 hypothetical protein LGH82_26385 [Mesorhizobium sp. PAMC28654]